MLSILSQRASKYSLTAILSLLKKMNMNKINHPTEYYFGYGANLSTERFQKKNMAVEDFGIAELRDYKINFSLPTESIGKGYASIEPSKNDIVYGKLFKISKLSLVLLDIMEWVPYRFYDRIKVTIYSNNKQIKNVNVYIASFPKKGLKPTKTYLHNIIKESKRLKFPQSYIEMLEKVEYGDNFKLDSGFRLSHTGKRRLFEKRLAALYLKHDKLRDIIASRLP